MASIIFASRFNEDGSFTIPPQAVETLGLHPGDEITVWIEIGNGGTASEHPAQAELQRRAARLFEEADRLVREPGKPLTDSQEAAWAEGIEEKVRRTCIRF